MLFKVLKLVLPKRARNWLRSHPLRIHAWMEPWRLLSAYLYDFRRYMRHSLTEFSERLPFKRLTNTQLKAFLVMHAHSIERGLSLQNVRPLFGEQKLKLLDRLVAEASSTRRRLSLCDEVTIAREALLGYVVWHRVRGVNPIDVYPFLLPYSENSGHLLASANILLTRDEVLRSAKGTIAQAIASRYSVRQFLPTRIDEEAVHQAMAIASKSPSVCNRQGFRVHEIRDAQRIREALLIQGGSSGFLEAVPLLLVVSTKAPVFFGLYERNQPFVDGGLYAMSLMLAFHYLGWATCPLNWCASPGKDRHFRRAFSFPDDELIVMFLAVGQMPEQLLVPASRRLRHVMRPSLL